MSFSRETWVRRAVYAVLTFACRLCRGVCCTQNLARCIVVLGVR
eukprot:COSAG02_NODE_47107_length_343_cov_1.266393_1_plen_43_part_01